MELNFDKLSKARIKIFVLLLIITPLGFLCKFYSGPISSWINNSIAGLLYEIFWIFVALFFLPKRKYIIKIVFWVFLTTSLLELLQLWHSWVLEQIRATFIGRSLIGTSFVWWDFLYYALGCLIGWYLAKFVLKSEE